MKKRTCLLLFCLFTLVLCLGLASCKENPPVNNDPIVWSKPVPLPAPTGLAIADDVLIWEPVEGAEGYTVLCDGKRYICEGTSLDVSNIITRPNVEFSFTVIAKGDGRKALDSLSSEPLLYTLSVSSEGVDFIKYEGFDYYVAYAKDPTKVVGSIYIPGEYEGKPVKEIMTDGFQGCTELTHIFLHEDIKRIGEYAFAGCTELKSITLSKSLLVIGFCAFQDCVSLTSVNFPEQLSEVSGTAFLGCTSLVELKVQSNNTTFRAEANCLIRRYNNELTVYAGDGSGVLPSSVQAIGAYAFYRSPLKTVVLHEGITKIGDYAFSESAIQNPSLPSTLTAIGGNAFSYCEGITKLVLIHSIDRIEARAFYSCPSLSLISFTGFVYYIGTEAFYELDQAVIMLPANHVRHMADNVFKGENMVIYLDYDTTPAPPWEMAWYPWPMNWGTPEISGGENLTITWKERFVSYCTNCTFGIDEHNVLYVLQTRIGVYHGGSMDDGAYGGAAFVIENSFQYEDDELIYNVRGLVFYKEYTPVPVREGYTFLGWALEEDGPVVIEVHEGGKTLTRQDVASCTAPETATTLYAVWEKN